jgi:hypothetical protein
MSGSPEMKTILNSMNKRFPNLVDFSIEYLPGTLAAITVWTTKDEMTELERFIAGVDREK